MAYDKHMLNVDVDHWISLVFSQNSLQKNVQIEWIQYECILSAPVCTAYIVVDKNMKIVIEW